ncbi:MAG: DEAD/DEAH box helicase [Phycisphaerae bacterium]
MDRDEVCSKFLDACPFDLYPVQEEALLAWFEEPSGLLICAPTGMGKTLIAEAAIFEALHTRKRLYYTTPLIALTEQKFREFQNQAEAWGFARDDIGLVTGNRRENPDALVRVVVAEILLNHLLGKDQTLGDLELTTAVVMDEFHFFNDWDRGVVWELSLVLLPAHVRVMLLSATVGNPFDFARWLRTEHGRSVRVINSNERRVPLEFNWVDDQLMTELLPSMISDDDAANRVPALVFCFNRDECWEVAERLKGLPLITAPARQQIETLLHEHKDDFVEGVGPKLRQMLIRGVGVHHAGVLPKHKEIVEMLFNRKLIPLVICTETLAAGINLPARSVVLSTLLKGPFGDKKLVPASGAHQMFGRAGRPQFDSKGYVFALAHEDDIKYAKWKKKFEQIDLNSKDPGILRARKQLERKRPKRRKTEQYWVQGHFNQLIQAGPANLRSGTMIPYPVLIYLLTQTGSVTGAKQFLAKRFNEPPILAKFAEQLDFMLDNLAGLGYLTRSDDGQHVTLHDSINRLLTFRSIDPLYGDFLSGRLGPANDDEKILAVESVLQLPNAIMRHVRIPEALPKGPLQENELEPLMIQMGVVLGRVEQPDEDPNPNALRWDDDYERPPTFPEMLQKVFEAKLAAPEPVFVQPKWIAGQVFGMGCDFFKMVKALNLIKQEGLILRHLLRFVILATEFHTLTEDPSFAEMAEKATATCRNVDTRYTDRFLE